MYSHLKLLDGASYKSPLPSTGSRNSPTVASYSFLLMTKVLPTWSLRSASCSSQPFVLIHSFISPQGFQRAVPIPNLQM